AGKSVIVTGGANGVGLAIGRHLVDQGARVMFADMDDSRLCKELDEDAEHNDNIRYFAGDLREKLTINNLLSATIDAFERVDVLVNASRQLATSEPLDPDADMVSELLAQNLMPALRLTQRIAKRMIKQGKEQEEGCKGSIVNLSSIAARRSNPALLGYSVSCAALDQMTRSMAVSLAPKGIRINSVAFGSVMSASLQHALKENRAVREEIEDHTPLGRIASATEVAEAVQYLASEASSFVTGQILTIDGGRTLLDPVSAPAH
ncbi:MAG: SDR family NAD(P)-dependent oxidoreductase, partial [Paracoccaceae bacterium]|nr:SDR family NAD(P)-dependent oxidoreductase [Paracoccaceae bacterium]